MQRNVIARAVQEDLPMNATTVKIVLTLELAMRIKESTSVGHLVPA